MWTPQRREVVALLAVLDLAASGEPRGWLKTQAIAERHGIPLAFLEQIVNRLRHNRILASRRGPAGGLRLARPAATLPVSEVLRAVAINEPAAAAATPRSLEQLVLRQLGQASLALEHALATMTVEQLLADAERLGLVPRRKSALSFDI